ncbi:MAG: SMC-Scp complex subunit ScpB [Spirochaetaceae bacterium]|nr:SMC-Scp complex subunit ScpB [Spirochaetaceae bacterium]
MEKETALIEAILYLESDPAEVTKLVRISGLSRDAVDAALEALDARYAGADSGVEISRIGGGVMIAPKREYWENLKERYGRRNEKTLSRAALETLSIIAYSQPITRGEIEALRGVQADNMIRLLVERKLIEEIGKKDVPGKPAQYGTTREFLAFFRLESIGDLPRLGESEADRFELDGEN